MRQLLIAGAGGFLVLIVLLVLLIMRYQGDFADNVNVTANLTTTGDGLPSDADVKFRGILVGSVKSVQIAALGEVQQVRIALNPEYAGQIPDTVTARVIPANVFAISAVELVDNGPGPGLRDGSQIAQDTSHTTVVLQNTLTTVRNVLAQIDPLKLGRVLGTLSYALDSGGRAPGSTIARLDTWVTQMRAAFPDFGGDLNNFADAADALNQSAPELVDSLGDSVKLAATIADRRAELAALLTGTRGTVDTVNSLFAANPDAGTQVTAGLSNTFGALAQDPEAIPNSFTNLDDSLHRLDGTFRWGTSGQMVWRAGISFSPFTPYTRADCPRYGDLAGPSCATAPLVAAPQAPLPESMRPHSLTGLHYGPDGQPLPVAAPAAPGPGGPTPPLFAGSPLALLFPPPVSTNQGGAPR